MFSFPEGVRVATEDDETERLLSLISICLGEDIDIVEALLGLVSFMEEFWRGDVREEIVPLEDAPEDVMEADIIEEPVMDELKFVEVEYPDVIVFEAVELLTTEKLFMEVWGLVMTMLLLILLEFMFCWYSMVLSGLAIFTSLVAFDLGIREPP